MGSRHMALLFAYRQAGGIRLRVAASGFLTIHSRDDQVAPFDPTEARIADLQNAAVNAKLIALANESLLPSCNDFSGTSRY